jgi:hypothetical protein
MLKEKAKKLTNLKEAQQINRKTEAANIKAAVFFELFANLAVSKHQKHLKCILLKKRTQ